MSYRQPRVASIDSAGSSVGDAAALSYTDVQGSKALSIVVSELGRPGTYDIAAIKSSVVASLARLPLSATSAEVANDQSRVVRKALPYLPTLLELQPIGGNGAPWPCMRQSTTSATLMCTVMPGVGRNLPLAVSKDSVLAEQSTVTVSYARPEIRTVVNLDAGRRLPTEGGTLIELIGDGLGLPNSQLRTQLATEGTVEGWVLVGRGRACTEVQCLCD